MSKYCFYRKRKPKICQSPKERERGKYIVEQSQTSFASAKVIYDLFVKNFHIAFHLIPFDSSYFLKKGMDGTRGFIMFVEARCESVINLNFKLSNLPITLMNLS